MSKYKITAVYKSVRELTVTVPVNEDPLRPENWINIEDEHEMDFFLYDTDDAEAVTEE